MDKKTHAIACVALNEEGKILLLKRSPEKKLFPNKWFVVAAYPMDENDDFVGKVHSELIEETGADGEIVKDERVQRTNEGKIIKMHVFLAKRNQAPVKLNDEHTEYKWVSLKEVRSFDTVSGTYEMVVSLFK